jgi:predicted permease
MQWPSWRRTRRAADLDEEIRGHLEMAARERIERGQATDDAERAARREFGNVGLIKEVTREMWGWTSVERLVQDLRYGARLLRRSPGFTIVAVLSLALGIGANSAIFSLINAVLLKTLPVGNPEQLVLFAIVSPRDTDVSFSYPAYDDYRNLNAVFDGVAASGGTNRMTMVVHEPGASAEFEPVRAEKVSGNFFSVLGVGAVAGRTLTEADDRPGDARAVTVISYGFWNRRFGLDPSVVGKPITLGDLPFTIVGVAPPGFSGFEIGTKPDLWWPLQMETRFAPGTDMNQRGWTWLRLMGRLRPGVSVAQARAAVNEPFQRELAETLRRREANNNKRLTVAQRNEVLEQRLELQPGQTGWTKLRSQFQQPLLIVMTVVGLVLLVACANVATLLLARAAARHKEIAVRVALGASRARLVRQLLTESVLLAGMGGVLGLIVARWGAGLLLAYVPNARWTSLDLDPDARMLGFTMVVSLLTGILFGLAPALRATTLALTPALKEQTSASGSHLTLNKMLVVSQVALSLFLLIGTGLFVRTLQNLRSVDLGFRPDPVTMFSLDTGRGYDAARRAALYQRVLERLEAVPGVQVASLSAFGLLTGNSYGQRVLVEGYTPQPDENMSCSGMVVGPKFFETMGIPILRGRGFDTRDHQAVLEGQSRAPRAAVINQTMARYFFGDADPIGRRFATPGKPNDPIEIVGVAKDTKYRTVREQTPRAFYLPSLSSQGVVFEVRTAGRLAGIGEIIRQTIRTLDPRVQVSEIRTMRDVVDESLVRERFLVTLSSFFSLFALLLASIGLYGVMSYSVARRTSEIGVRMALGATEDVVLWLVLRETLGMVLLGIAIGVPLALASTQLVSSLLYGLAATDPATMTVATLVLLTAAALAAYLPARRAARVDPIVALRSE